MHLQSMGITDIIVVIADGKNQFCGFSRLNIIVKISYYFMYDVQYEWCIDIYI